MIYLLICDKRLFTTFTKSEYVFWCSFRERWWEGFRNLMFMAAMVQAKMSVPQNHLQSIQIQPSRTSSQSHMSISGMFENAILIILYKKIIANSEVYFIRYLSDLAYSNQGGKGNSLLSIVL